MNKKTLLSTTLTLMAMINTSIYSAADSDLNKDFYEEIPFTYSQAEDGPDNQIKITYTRVVWPQKSHKSHEQHTIGTRITQEIFIKKVPHFFALMPMKEKIVTNGNPFDTQKKIPLIEKENEDYSTVIHYARHNGFFISTNYNIYIPKAPAEIQALYDLSQKEKSKQRYDSQDEQDLYQINLKLFNQTPYPIFLGAYRKTKGVGENTIFTDNPNDPTRRKAYYIPPFGNIRIERPASSLTTNERLLIAATKIPMEQLNKTQIQRDLGEIIPDSYSNFESFNDQKSAKVLQAHEQNLGTSNQEWDQLFIAINPKSIEQIDLRREFYQPMSEYGTKNKQPTLQFTTKKLQ